MRARLNLNQMPRKFIFMLPTDSHSSTLLECIDSHTNPLWAYWLSEPITAVLSSCQYHKFFMLLDQSCDLEQIYLQSPWSKRITKILLDFLLSLRLITQDSRARLTKTELLTRPWEELLKYTYQASARFHPLSKFLSSSKNNSKQEDVNPHHFWASFTQKHRRSFFDQHLNHQLALLYPWIAQHPIWTKNRALIELGGANGYMAHKLLTQKLTTRVDIIDLHCPKNLSKQDDKLFYHQQDFFHPLPKELLSLEDEKNLLLINILHDWPLEVKQLIYRCANALKKNEQFLFIDMFATKTPELIPSLFQLQLLPYGGALLSLDELSTSLQDHNLQIYNIQKGPGGYRAIWGEKIS